MNQEHTFKVINRDNFAKDIYPVVKMEIDGEASVEELLYSFERFLQAIGYVLPQNSNIELVERENHDLSRNVLNTIGISNQDRY
jgi:hypothetical protein